MSNLSAREQLLVALGSALGANCVPCVESIFPKARAAGIEDAELKGAVELADKVRRKPARLVLETARGLLREGSSIPVEEEGPCPLENLGKEQETETGQACCG